MRREIQDVSHSSLHSASVRANLRHFAYNCDIDMGELTAPFLRQPKRLPQEYFGCGALPLRVAWREVAADVPSGDGAEDGVRHCVHGDVCVRMASKSLIMGDINAA
jgi:hypothetical protein